jgi:guanylate kinase
MKNENNIFVIAGPSGVGKDTVMKELEKFNLPVERVITTASRPMRPDENEGNPYYFVSEEKFADMVEAGEFVEHAQVFNSRKGITKKALKKVLNKDKGVLIQIEHQGARTIKKLYPEANIIIIAPPSIQDLNNRLMGRKTIKAKDELAKRLSENQRWTEDYAEFNTVVENPTGHPELAAAKIADIIKEKMGLS